MRDVVIVVLFSFLLRGVNESDVWEKIWGVGMDFVWFDNCRFDVKCCDVKVMFVYDVVVDNCKCVLL